MIVPLGYVTTLPAARNASTCDEASGVRIICRRSSPIVSTEAPRVTVPQIVQGSHPNALASVRTAWRLSTGLVRLGRRFRAQLASHPAAPLFALPLCGAPASVILLKRDPFVQGQGYAGPLQWAGRKMGDGAAESK